jgi:hypothetical protein
MAPAACGGTGLSSSSNEAGASGTTSDATQIHESTIDATSNDALQFQGGDDASDGADSCCQSLSLSDGEACYPACRGGCFACDPTPFEDGGTGPCAPRWTIGDGCQGGSVLFPCGLAAAIVPDANTYYGQQCAPYCLGATMGFCSIWTEAGTLGSLPLSSEAGTMATVVSCGGLDCTGRRPAALHDERARPARNVGDVLARAAYLEAASVHAFLELARQLDELGAPSSLVRRARRAAEDEVRHARVMRALAEARGGVVPAVRPVQSEGGDVLAIAMLNACEGCVRETWGATVAVVQARTALDRELRQAMLDVARDELEHASLSWDIADWIATRLTAEQRDAVEDSRNRAVSELVAEANSPVPERLRATLGLPSIGEARSMLDAMRTQVWHRAA